ncbi:MAG: SpoIID/LytB domain-containing protein [Patescibacteria group bacterium]
MQDRANALSVNGFSHVTWRYYNQIKKKAMDKEPDLLGLLISLSIAFFIVVGGAAGLNSIYRFYSEAKLGNEAGQRRESHQWESAYQYIALTGSLLGNAGERIMAGGLKIDIARAAESDLKGQPEKGTHYLEFKAGETISYSLKIKNTGKSAWKKGEIFLETGSALKRPSLFKDGGWLKYFRLAGLTGDVLPGKTAEFKFNLASPAKTGDYQEDLQLVKNGELPVAGTLTRIFINVASKASIVPLPANPAAQTPLTSSVAVQNTAAAQTNVNTNANSKDFCIALAEEDKKQYEECNTNPNETGQGSGIASYANFLNEEPIIRVGLFSAKSAHRIISSGFYDVYSGKELIYSGLGQNAQSSLAFNFTSKIFTLKVNGISKNLSGPIRFVSRDKDGLITLPDYEARPAWNKSLNDNIFRNTVEFNYSQATKKLWAINELPIENYLKGLAETSNISHIEFQKTLITAARTYALYHYSRGLDYKIPDGSTKHADEHFHVDAAYDQVYRGYGSEIRMPNLVKAVNDTRGAIVTYNEEIAITPYFSRSDGRTRSWIEVWGGKAMAWLVSVLVPEDNGQALWGHGVGMSARGALLMANAGKGWQEILKYFYSGTDLKKLYN